MNNELIPKTSMPPAAQKVEQTGSTNVHVTNQGGGVVNINYNYQQPGGSNSAEQLMAIQSFSKEYYQLLVTCEEDVFINKDVYKRQELCFCHYPSHCRWSNHRNY